ncbi:MAG: hypothetical protein EOO45_11005 [Flavobacterium sp.]|nr:MAG: hypothetical protein EOO45_11005 [Flavobacterium sp.]
MRLNNVIAILSVGICALIAYGFYSFNDNPQKLMLSLGSFILLTATLLMTLAVRFDDYRTAVNARVVSMVFFSLAFVTNVVFSFFNFSSDSYIIINGIIFLLYLLLMYFLVRPQPN